MASQVAQGLVAQGLPARPADEEAATVAAAEVIPELVAGEGAAEGEQHHHLEVQVAAQRQVGGQ